MNYFVIAVEGNIGYCIRKCNTILYFEINTCKSSYNFLRTHMYLTNIRVFCNLSWNTRAEFDRIGVDFKLCLHEGYGGILDVNISAFRQRVVNSSTKGLQKSVLVLHESTRTTDDLPRTMMLGGKTEF